MNRDEYRAHPWLTARHGEQCATKLSEQQALEIRRRRELGRHYMEQARALSAPALARKFGITRQAVDRIIAGKRWAAPHPGKSHYRGITYEDAQLIRQCAEVRDEYLALAAEQSSKTIASEYGVSAALVYQISTGRKWVYLEARREAR